MNSMKAFRYGVALALLLAPTTQLLPADEQTPDAKALDSLVSKAIAFLRASQSADGSFSPRLAGPGVTAVVAAGLLRNGVSAQDPLVARALTYLEKSVKQDGGVYDKALANYTTSVALM